MTATRLIYQTEKNTIAALAERRRKYNFVTLLPLSTPFFGKNSNKQFHKKPVVILNALRPWSDQHLLLFAKEFKLIYLFRINKTSLVVDL